MDGMVANLMALALGMLTGEVICEIWKRHKRKRN